MLVHVQIINVDNNIVYSTIVKAHLLIYMCGIYMELLVTFIT